MSAREEILGRVRAALADPPGQRRAQDPVVRAYRRRGERDADELVALFAERCAEYRAGVRCVAAADVPAAIAATLRGWSARRVAIPPGVPRGWCAEGIEWIEDRGLDHAVLDGADAVLTGCAVAVAETGTIALDAGPGQGRRALTLIPDRHVCVVEVGRIVEQLPEAIARLAASARAGRPITLIAGPSATSDIELERVEGVHGPRVLEVVCCGA
ncbi:MAG TPA: LUD domain-containing protein [Conexibacter sp.]|nr:LUD domain-containing protein [Conexibacter sp.]